MGPVRMNVLHEPDVHGSELTDAWMEARCQRLHAEACLHVDWHALDRGTLDPVEAVRRASERTGLPEETLRAERAPRRVVATFAAVASRGRWGRSGEATGRR